MKKIIILLVISIFLAGCTLNKNTSISVNKTIDNINNQVLVNEIPKNNDLVVVEENKKSFDLGQEFFWVKTNQQILTMKIYR